MINIPTQAISFNLYYGGSAPTEMDLQGTNGPAADEEVPALTEETPVFRNITIKNITCKGAAQAVFLQGLPEQNLEKINLENINIEAVNGLTCIDANGVTVKGMELITKNLPVLNISNSQNIEIEELDIPANQNPSININGGKTRNITIRLTKPAGSGISVLGDEVDDETIKIL